MRKLKNMTQSHSLTGVALLFWTPAQDIQRPKSNIYPREFFNHYARENSLKLRVDKNYE